MEPNSSSAISLAKLKKFFLKTTIILLAASAIIAIIAVLVLGNEFTFKILATTLLLSLFSLISTNNIMRLSSQQTLIRATAITAIVTDAIWLVLWLCLLWGLAPAFTPATYTFYAITWRVIFSSLFVAIASTIISSFIGFYRIKESAIQALSSLVIICTTLLALVTLLNIWVIPKVLPWQLYTILLIMLIFGAITTPILAKTKQHNTPKATEPPLDQTELRAQIEREVRAKIAAEQSAQSAPEQNTENS